MCSFGVAKFRGAVAADAVEGPKTEDAEGSKLQQGRNYDEQYEDGRHDRAPYCSDGQRRG